VIEGRRVPTLGGMATSAIRHRKSRPGGGVHRIICLPPGRQVTLRVPAVGRRDLKAIVAVDVARGTGHVRMAIGQGEVDRRCTMIEVCSQPTIERVARFAGGPRRSCGNPRIALPRERLGAENDSGDLLLSRPQYSSPGPSDIARSPYPSFAGECRHDNSDNACRPR